MKRKSDKQLKTEYNRQMSFGGLLVISLVLCGLMAVLYVVQASVPYSLREESIKLLPESTVFEVKEKQQKRESEEFIVIFEEDDATCKNALGVIEPVLSQMKVDYSVITTDKFTAKDFDKCKYCILAVTHFQVMGDYLSNMRTWVNNGGNMMVLTTPEYSGSFMSLADIFGVKECGGNILVAGVSFKDEFLIGGNGASFEISDPYESSLAIRLTDSNTVYMESTDKYPVPLLWRRNVGNGTVVFDNFGIFEKAYRGIHGAAVSLMGSCFAYPVINGATFYIDDFPSPIPDGDGKYITRDYNLSIEDFYIQVWWNNVYDLGKENGISYTGLVIEDYGDQIDGIWKRNDDIERFRYFGNMLLQMGGEIGIHGYNHMPLVLDDFDYLDEFDDYIQWKDPKDIANAISEVRGFTNSLFPDEELQVYVPPSNILSEDGRTVLEEQGFKTIASVYLEGVLPYVQEFNVSGEDGIVNTPRVVSGYIFDDYTKFAALSELNFHLVSTHFQHPDDVLDEDRGAELGWQEMISRLADYMKWLYGAFPSIRNLTGSELAAAVERYDLINVERELSDNNIVIKLDNLYDEAYMIFRVNEGKHIKKMTGGTYTKVYDKLYVLECTSDEINIELTEGE